MTKMYALRVTEFGGSSAAVYTLTERPTLSPVELLIRIHAAGVNPVDWKTRQGYLRQVPQVQLPMTLGWDFAGVVEEVAAGVTHVQAGDEVYGMIFLRGGSFAEYAAVRPMEVALKPRSLSMVDAAGVAAAALTAWQALHNVLRIRSGQRILIHAAAGGVGMFAVQMAKLAGAQVVATASAANYDFVRSLGADDVIDYRSTRFDEAVGDLDAVMDNVGGEVLERSWKVLRPGGTLATAADQIDPTAVPAGFYGKRIQVQPDAKDLSEIAALIDGGQLRIMTSQVLSLADGRAALDLSETGHVRGKLVLQVC